MDKKGEGLTKENRGKDIMAKPRCKACVVASSYIHTITLLQIVLIKREGRGLGL